MRAMARVAVLAVLAVVLGACASNRYQQNAPIDTSNKTMALPWGSHNLLGEIKEGLRKQGWRVVTYYEKGDSPEARYYFLIRERQFDFCLNGSAAINYDFAVIDANDFSEVITHSGRDCEDRAAKHFLAALSKSVQNAENKAPKKDPGEKQPSEISENPKPPQMAGTGSGYVIHEDGYVLTNHHVAGKCKSLKLRRGETTVPAEYAAGDRINDLAVVRGNFPGVQPVRFRGGDPIRAADGVVAIGYPIPDIMESTEPKVTTGTVTALVGLQDDTREMQISAPIHPGNSGGPVFDLAGNVVGTVNATLKTGNVVARTRQVPQNVNFAIKLVTMREFLDSKQIPYRTAPSTRRLDPADVAEIGLKSVVMIECYK